MRRTVVIVPGMLSGPDFESHLRQRLPSLEVLGEIGVLRKVAQVPESETPEGMLLGLGPAAVQLRQGPLTVSAFGFDPPERSTHFHLSLMSYTDGELRIPTVLPGPAELENLMAAAARLNTKLLTTLKGESLDHALVWEALGDLGTRSAESVDGKMMLENLPEGDGENALRRLIDDSVNLLSSLELNERRTDQGLPAFNVLWPWGHGVRTPVPNLALRRGEPAVVESGSMRLAGLTRLAGYKHFDRIAFGTGLKTKLRAVASRCLERNLSIAFVDSVEQLRAEDKHEELEWFLRELDRELLKPLLEDHLKTPSRLTLIAPGCLRSAGSASPIGLSLSAETNVPSTNIYPFDERSLDERTVPRADLWTLVEGGLEPR